MKRLLSMLALALPLMPGAAPAQSPQPYAGFESLAVKALSDREISDLKAGRGMGLALAAELNGYPGPAHLLELAEPLGLSDTQRSRVQALFEAMKGEAIPTGEALIAEEAALDREFANKTITKAALFASLDHIGSIQAKLRATHLQYHLATVEILTAEQMRRYAEMRGPMPHHHDNH
jgi:Spy/CpxP family protein refolding chaperone